MNEKFDAKLPSPYSDNWRQAERSDADDAPRLTSYEAPGGKPVIFVLESFSFSGGQSVDTAEYPFGGMWSNERLNEKPQALSIQGFIRGTEYIKSRNALVESLRIVTDDGASGFIDLPFWGRFPVVVIDYEVSEKTDEKGQCAVRIDFKRAGVPVESRAITLPNIEAKMNAATAALETAAIGDFEKKLKSNFDAGTLFKGFAKIKGVLQDALGRIQAAQTMLNNITAEINGISSLIAQAISAPGKLAKALFNSVASIVGGLMEIKNSFEAYLGGSSSGTESGSSGASGNATGNASAYPAPIHNNEKNVLMQFLSASSYMLDTPAATIPQKNTKEAMENLYRAVAFSAASQIITQLDMPYQKASGYWNLLEKLEESIDKETPELYEAITAVRICVSRALTEKELSSEKTRTFTMPVPLLVLAQYLGCDEDKLRELNRIADSFVVKGGVVYV
jgi:hypothetical protein